MSSNVPALHGHAPQGDISVLDAPTDPADLKKRDGAGSQKFDYIPAAKVQRKLNQAFGHAWRFEILETTVLQGPTRDHPNMALPVEVLVRGRLSYMIGGEWCHRDQFGVQSVEYANDYDAPKKNNKWVKSNRPVSLGKAHQGAATKALRKCAESLGIGLDLKEGGETIQEEVSKDDLQSTLDAMGIDSSVGLALLSFLFSATIQDLSQLRKPHLNTAMNFLSTLYDTHQMIAPETDVSEFVIWVVGSKVPIHDPRKITSAVQRYQGEVNRAKKAPAGPPQPTA